MPREMTASDDDQILAAIAAERPAMEDLLVRLVEAPTLLNREGAGQAIMRGAFEELGLAPIDVPLDAQALRAHPDASPFSWDLAGKANVVARWQATEPVDGRSLVLNGHIDVVSPEPTAAWSAAFLSPRPTQRPAAIAAASVTRTSSSARFLSGGVATRQS